MNNSAVGSAEFAACLAPIFYEPPERIAVAVSGGPDSMALLTLLSTWAIAHHVSLHALTVDHGLRPSAGAECRQVAAWCEALGVPHTILTWQHETVRGGVQQKAREARYALMLGWCRAERVRHLFLAHHADDQIETFFFRLARGSGMEGLACMQALHERDGVLLHRPLLGFSKARLIATAGDEYIVDTSNHSTRYMRGAVRPQLAALGEKQRERALTLIAFFARFRAQMELSLAQSMEQCFMLEQGVYGHLAAGAFHRLPPELQTRVAQQICMTIGGSGEPVRTEQLARLVAALNHPMATPKTMLHGVAFHFLAKQKQWLCVREKKRIAPAIPISCSPVLWDGRYSVSARQNGYYLGALGKTAREFAELFEKQHIPKAAWATFPAIWHLEECAAIPHIGYVHPAHAELVVELAFIDAKPLAVRRNYAMNDMKKYNMGERARA